MNDKTKQLKTLAVEYKTATPDRQKSIKREMVQLVADMLQPEASKIASSVEGRLATTQNHYGDYMSYLSSCPDTLTRLGLAQALISAGANRQGVTSALSLCSN